MTEPSHGETVEIAEDAPIEAEGNGEFLDSGPQDEE